MCILGYVIGNPGEVGNLVPEGAEKATREQEYYVALLVQLDRVWLNVT